MKYVDEYNAGMFDPTFIFDEFAKEFGDKLDSHDWAISQVVAGYFNTHPMTDEKRAQIVKVSKACSKRLDRADTQKMHDYLYDQWLSLLDDKEDRDRIKKMIDDSREY